jgi:hypothetical protein
MPADISQMWVGIVIMASVPAYLVVQILLAITWRGGWRIAALVPLIIMLPALALTVYATSQGSNLGPLALIMAAPLSLLYLVIALVVRRLTSSAAA